MHYLLLYDFVPDYLQRRGAFRGAHLKLAWDACERGELLLGGALTEDPDGGVAGDKSDEDEREDAHDEQRRDDEQRPG